MKFRRGDVAKIAVKKRVGRHRPQNTGETHRERRIKPDNGRQIGPKTISGQSLIEVNDFGPLGAKNCFGAFFN